MNLNFHSTTIELNSKQQLNDLDYQHHLDLQKDNHLLEFNQLEDIYNFCNPRNTIEIRLKKGLRGLGISLCGGKKFQVDQAEDEELEQSFSLINQLIRVKKLYPAQPAYECGLIEENDIILDANGHCFVGLTYIEAFNILHKVKDEVCLRILKFNQCPLELKNFLIPNELNESSLDNSYSFKEPNIFESTRIIDSNEEQSSSTQQVRNKITLIKKDGSLGFILSKIENEGFYIKQITKEPASLAKINPGDRILSVNETSLDGLDLPSAISFLRSLPDICELELEQTVTCDSLDNSLNYNDQSETEEDNKLKKRQLRHEVKIMLDNRSKDTLYNRLKRKDLKKSKDCLESSRGQKLERSNQSMESESTHSSLDECNHRLEPNNNLEKDKFDKENIFMKLANDKNQFVDDGLFYRQSSVIDFSKNNESGRQLISETSFIKSNNLNKWRNTVLTDEKDDSLEVKNAVFKKNKFKDDLDEDSGFGDSMNKTNNLSDNNSINMCINEQDADLVRLSDIQLKLNNNCLINENSKLYRNIDALFFYVVLDRIGWAGRLGFSLTDDQSNDYRVVNTMKYGFSACVVKEIYPNSLAFSNGMIKVGDKLLEVNNQQMINKPVQTVIKDLRKMKGKLRLLFLRKRCYIDSKY